MLGSETKHISSLVASSKFIECIRLTNLSSSHTVDTMKAAKAKTIASPVHCQFSFKPSISIYQRMPTRTHIL